LNRLAARGASGGIRDVGVGGRPIGPTISMARRQSGSVRPWTLAHAGSQSCSLITIIRTCQAAALVSALVADLERGPWMLADVGSQSCTLTYHYTGLSSLSVTSRIQSGYSACCVVSPVSYADQKRGSARAGGSWPILAMPAGTIDWDSAGISARSQSNHWRQAPSTRRWRNWVSSLWGVSWGNF
jgi:hypothetical protein